MDGERNKQFLANLSRGPWSFNFSYGDRRKDDPIGTYLSDPLTPGQYQQDRHLLTQLQYQDDFAESTLHLLSRLFLGQERYTAPFSFNGDRTVQTASSDWQGGEIRLLFTSLAKHKLMLGFEYQNNARQDQTFENINSPTNNVIVPGESWRMGIYTQDEWMVTDTLSATLGLRFDRNNVTGEKLSPRAALLWQATTTTSVKALYGRAHRAPNVFERDFNYQSQVANPSLNGETIDTLELVMDQRVARDLNLRGSIYQWTMQGLVTLGTDPVSSLPQYQNGEAVKATGIEISADKTWDWGGRLRGSWSYQHTRYNSGTGLDNSPQWLGKLNFSSPLPVPGLRSGYELQYNSDRQAINGSQLDNYWLSNLNLTADKLLNGLEVSLGIYNLFDTRYEQPGSRNNWQTALEQDGRQFRLKVIYAF